MNHGVSTRLNLMVPVYPLLQDKIVVSLFCMHARLLFL